MIEQTKCPSCGQPYEITWDDTVLDDFGWDDDLGDAPKEEVDPTDADPTYCPFCGVHRDYDE